MALEIEWTDTAEAQLDDIIAYFESNWTPKEIRQFFKKLEQGIDTIGIHPEQHKKSLRKANAYEYQLSPQTTIFYTFDSKKVTILLLWSNRMNTDNL
jgi:plasmid stabilization system protein ParE